MNRAARFILTGLFLFLILFAATVARADSVSFQLSSASLTAVSGSIGL